jgi:hypothetical protein
MNADTDLIKGAVVWGALMARGKASESLEAVLREAPDEGIPESVKYRLRAIGSHPDTDTMLSLIYCVAQYENAEEKMEESKPHHSANLVILEKAIANLEKDMG